VPTAPKRSWMFVPGNNPRYLTKASQSIADAVLLDLEDGVPPADKETARGMVADVLVVPDFLPQRFVRLNAVSTPWFDDDLAALVPSAPAGFCVPKVDTPDVVHEVSAKISKLEAEAGLAAGSVRLVAAIESAISLVNAPAIAAADPRLVGIMFGAEDYALNLGLGTVRKREAAELIYARSAIVVAAASADIDSIDGVFPDLDDPEGMLNDIQRSRDLGFSGKSTFNPRQLEDVNRIFSPQPDEIEYASRVVAAFDEAQARGDGSVAVGGQLVDLPIVLRARRLLEIHATLQEA
jgi:citrate lyase subunit beta / citryl-CoA lyase